jgi:hypothetical protein
MNVIVQIASTAGQSTYIIEITTVYGEISTTWRRPYTNDYFACFSKIAQVMNFTIFYINILLLTGLQGIKVYAPMNTMYVKTFDPDEFGIADTNETVSVFFGFIATYFGAMFIFGPDRYLFGSFPPAAAGQII